MDTWVDIPGFEGFYEVSDKGVVRSKERSVLSRNRFGEFVRTYKSAEKAPGVGTDGYPMVSLCRDGKQKSYRLSRIVLLSFIGPGPDGAEACHSDHNKLNNELENLHWGTRRENEAEKTQSGRRPKSTVNKLTRDDAVAIRSLHASGQSLKRIAELFKTHHSNVWLIVKGHTWQA